MKNLQTTAITPTLAAKPAYAGRGLSLGLGLLAAVLLSACASLGTQAPEDLVKQRAGARWQALLAGDFDKAYSFSTPAYRALVTPQTFRGRFGPAVKWVGAEVTKVECPEPAKCAVQVKLDYVPVLAGRVDGHYSTYLDEPWLLEANQWWFYQPVGK